MQSCRGRDQYRWSERLRLPWVRVEKEYVFVLNQCPIVQGSRRLQEGIASLEAMGGQLFLGSGRGRGKLFLRVSAYLLDRANTKDELREAVSLTCAEFGLHAEIDS